MNICSLLHSSSILAQWNKRERENFNNDKEGANKDVELEAKSPYYSLFHHFKKHK
jgi:hypothetical protein